MQVIVDCSLKFLHVSVSYPGSIHDARVLRLSGLFDLVNNQQILESPSRVINGTEVPPLIVGDSAYPLLKWLIKPYADRERLSPEERKFNIKLSAMRSVVERAFGMLKLRWRLVYKKVEQKTLKKTVIAACILHNICINHGDLCVAMQPTVQVILKMMKVKISAGRMVLKSEKHSKTMYGPIYNQYQCSYFFRVSVWFSYTFIL